MKTTLTILSLSVALLLTGCKNPNSIAPALLRLGVSTTAGYSLLKNPEAAPDVRLGASIVCALAHNTNVHPAEIVAALNARSDDFSVESVFILNAAIGAYSLVYNGLPQPVVPAIAQPYALATCDGLDDALLIALPPPSAGGAASLRRPSTATPTSVDWPQVRFK